jgi:signal peptidase
MLTRKVLLLPLLAFLLAWFFLFRPVSLGGPASYVMVSGVSMEPTLHSGDLVATRKHQSYQKGDIVAFRVEGGIVIHRIVGGSAEDGLIMQGDNKNAPDLWRPTADDIVGRMWFSIPGGGRFLGILQSPLVLAGLASGVAVFLVLSGGEEKKRPREVSPAKGSGGAGRLRPPPGLALLLLVILTATLVRSLAFTARH